MSVRVANAKLEIFHIRPLHRGFRTNNALAAARGIRRSRYSNESWGNVIVLQVALVIVDKSTKEVLNCQMNSQGGTFLAVSATRSDAEVRL